MDKYEAIQILIEVARGYLDEYWREYSDTEHQVQAAIELLEEEQ